MTYASLDWVGPLPFDSAALDRIPETSGVYLFSNSPSPFAFRTSVELTQLNQTEAGTPQVLYVGCSIDLRRRIAQHRTTPRPELSERGQLFLYCAATTDHLAVEKELITDLFPPLNRLEPSQLFDDVTVGQPQLHNRVATLENMLREQITSEEEYQRYFEANPWVLGLWFKSIQRHQGFDDKNIPDFTGVRSRDDCLDIIEIKQPFLQLTRADGEPNAAFDEIWRQAERYLDFARQDPDYLRRQKGMQFDNPYCHLILGHEPGELLRREIQRKHRMNPAILAYTYDQIVKQAKETLRLIEAYGDFGQRS